MKRTHLSTQRFTLTSRLILTERENFKKRGLLRWGWIFLERTRILSGIQFTTHFIEFFVVQTKRFVSSFLNVILTRRTCGQRSSRAAKSKRSEIGQTLRDRKLFFRVNLLYVSIVKM